MIADNGGNLYGETALGGNYSGSDCAASGCGTVFEVQPNGTKIPLYSFLGGNDGAGPICGVILDSFGDLYGTTEVGGGSGCGGVGCGTVFEISADGVESVLHTFQGGTDGDEPIGVTMDGAGNLYGVTLQGGNCTFQPYQGDCGTAYKLAPDGTKTLLYNFQGGNDGLRPWAPLIIDKKGDLYGTTFAGGGDTCRKSRAPKNIGYGCGTVFKLTPEGRETVLYAFVPQAGEHPSLDALFFGAHGEIDGAASYGGNKRGDGVVFEVKK